MKKDAIALALAMWEEACENESDGSEEEDEEAEDQNGETGGNPVVKSESDPKIENLDVKEEEKEAGEVKEVSEDGDGRAQKRRAEESSSSVEFDYVPPARKSRTELSAEERQKRLA